MAEDILQRIDQRLAVIKSSESKAAKDAGLSPDAIRNVRRGVKEGKPVGFTVKTIVALAPILRTTASWLIEGAGDEEAEGVTLPVISWVSASKLKNQEGIEPTDIERWIKLSDLPRGDWIGLVVHGDSMDRVAPDGSILLVNRADSTLIDGKYYVFADESGAATFKRWRHSPNRLQPYSTNPDHKSIHIDEPYVFGRVKRVISEL